MILRRLSQSLKEQNWTAICIEFVFLVVGVFLGIQVANWNAEREQDRKSVVFTERIKDNLRVEAWNLEMQIGYYGQVQANARRAADALSGHAPLPDEALLVAAFRATQYNDNTRQRTTFDELKSTGELGLIRDSGLRTLAMDVFSIPVFEQVAEEGRASQYRVAFRKQMPYRVQAALEAGCGDHVVPTGDYAGIATTLDYTCRIDLPATDITAAASALRGNPDILALLNLRITDVGTSIGNLTVYSPTLRSGLRTFVKEKP